jgi:hypothetical protein
MAARERVLGQHTAAVRAAELERYLEETIAGKPASALAAGSRQGDEA